MTLAIFGGTSEGRALGAALAARGARVHMFVATEYGEELVAPAEGLTVTAGRLDTDAMAREFEAHAYAAVVDATHPYAALVTENIRAACARTGIDCLRLTRAETADAGVRTVEDMARAAKALDDMPGNILLTVGSKELAAFTQVRGFRERVFARVLPSPEVVAGCVQLGLHGRNLICMQGPFTHEINTATIRMLDIRVLVTKDSGTAGGFPEKQSACAETGAELLVVGRPAVEEGLALPELLTLLEQRLELSPAESCPLPRFPLFVSLAGKAALVVGGGSIAARRVRVLLEFGAEVTVVSPSLCPQLEELAERIHWKRMRYDQIDQHYALAVAATDERDVNRQVGEDAAARGIPVSVADRKEESTFWFPAIARTDGLVAGIISTGGDHAAVKQAAAAVRRALEGTQ